jgi:hypothetical protein
MREISIYLQGFKGEIYEKIITIFLMKERQLLEDVLKLIHSSWSSMCISFILYGWTDTRCMPLINAIISSPKGAMFLR